MFLGKVIGPVWSTKKTPDLEGVRFLIVHPYDLDKEPTKNVVVVADRLGAGTGETVMCAFGKAARTAIGNLERPPELKEPVYPELLTPDYCHIRQRNAPVRSVLTSACCVPNRCF